MEARLREVAEMKIELKTPWLYRRSEGAWCYHAKGAVPWFCALELEDVLNPIFPKAPIPCPFRLRATSYKPRGKCVVIFVRQGKEGFVLWGSSSCCAQDTFLNPPNNILHPFVPKPKKGKRVGRIVRLYIILEFKK